jgi:hypothetical protein
VNSFLSKRFLDERRLAITVVGKAEELKEELASLGSLNVRYYLDPIVPIREIESVALKLKRFEEADEKSIREKLLQIAAAHGGLELINSIESMKVDFSSMVEIKGLGMAKMESTFWLKYSDVVDGRTSLFLTEIGKKMVERLHADRNGGYIETDSGRKKLKGELHKEMVASVVRNPIFIIKKAISEGSRLTMLKDHGIKGLVGESITIGLTTAEGYSTVVVVDRKSNLIRAIAYVTVLPVFGQVRIEEIYSDYRNVKGVILPFNVKRRISGQPEYQAKIKSITFNYSNSEGP